jgi:hypothetical protein
MRALRFTILAVACLALATSAMAQTSGSLSGRVTAEGSALPGVTVTATSPAMQGQRVAITDAAGGYQFPFLPVGVYNVTFALDGFQTLEYQTDITLNAPKVIDAEMYTAALEEEIIVTSQFETVSSGNQGSSTMQYNTLEKLPVARSVLSATQLAPGTAGTGPSGNTTISGAQSYENLYTLNGIVLNENLRGQPYNLFIEDAVQETTVITSGVSAEYGRFSGGVVNAVTKTGGNEFSASLRANFDNESWEAETPLTSGQEDTTNTTWEGTFGGYLLRDQLWFFTAARDRGLDGSGQLLTPGNADASVSYPTTNDETRYEGKLTWSINPSHRLSGSYIDVSNEQTNYAFFDPYGPGHISPGRNLPLIGYAGNYNGMFTENFFVEAQYSKREFTFEGGGGTDTDIARGTPVWDLLNGGAFNAPIFCSAPECQDEQRNAENWFAKGSLFFNAAGSHDLVFGYDTFDDIRIADNWQSASGYIYAPFVEQDYSDPGNPRLNIQPIGGYIIWGSVLEASQGTSFTTNSLFANDTWRVTDNLTVNIGVRWDENDGTDASGNKTVEDSRLSPRLGASWDITGDGEWILNASVGRYVASIANSIGDGGALGGQPTWAGYFYGGDPIVVGENAATNEEALNMVFDWFFNVYGGPSNGELRAWADIPGISPQIDQSLGSPYGDEYAIGITKRLGTRGVVRADYVHREYGDFYASEIIPNRFVVDEIAGPIDVAFYKNEDNLLERTYDAIMLRADYRFTDRISVGGNYTWSSAEGNWEGETAGSGPVPSGVLEYQEYKDPSWNTPSGQLDIDMEHKLQVWGLFDIISTSRHNLNASVLFQFLAGQPYSALGSVDTVGIVGDPADFGYAGGPGFVDYYYSDKGAFTTDDITRTDLAINYSFFVNAFGTELEMFVQPEILNVFGEEGVIDTNTTVLDSTNAGFESFNPFTETPVQGVNWDFGSSFGEPVNAADYQTPRTYRFSLGLRF